MEEEEDWKKVEELVVIVKPNCQMKETRPPMIPEKQVKTQEPHRGKGNDSNIYFIFTKRFKTKAKRREAVRLV